MSFLLYKKLLVSYKAKNKFIVPAQFAAEAATGDGYAKMRAEGTIFLCRRNANEQYT